MHQQSLSEVESVKQLIDQTKLSMEEQVQEIEENVEIGNMNKLLEEKSKMIEELQDKIKFMKKYINILERNDKGSPTPSIREVCKPHKNFKLSNSNIIQTVPDEIEISNRNTADRASKHPIQNKTEDVNKLGRISRTPKGRKITGTRSKPEDDKQKTFTGLKQRIWLHVGRVELNTTPEMIKKHLSQLFPGRSFVIEQQNMREGATSMSFKVGGEVDLKEELYDCNNWPSGVTIRRFDFFRRNRQQECK